MAITKFWQSINGPKIRLGAVELEVMRFRICFRGREDFDRT